MNQADWISAPLSAPRAGGKALIVGIAGGSGSGKTTVANRIRTLVEGSAVSVLVFIAVLFIAALFVKGFGANLDQQQGDL